MKGDKEVKKEVITKKKSRRKAKSRGRRTQEKKRVDYKKEEEEVRGRSRKIEKWVQEEQREWRKPLEAVISTE